jgi:subtilisin family serine protease
LIRRLLLLLALLPGAGLSAAPRAWRSGDSTDTVIVQWRVDAGRLGAKAEADLHAQAGAQRVIRTPILPIDIVHLPAGLSGADIDARLALYRADPGVLSAEPDSPCKLASAPPAPPNDPAYTGGHQLGLTATAWDLARAAYPASISFRAQVTVAVIDTGIDPHIDLSGLLLAGASFLAAPDDTTDDRNGHGTFVSGLIAALPDNGTAMTGAFLDPAYIRLLPVKVLDTCGSGSSSSVLQGVLYALDQGARVLNLSLSGLDQSDAVHAAFVEAQQRGAIVVAAAGNDSGATGYPASDPTVLSVAALDSTGGPAWYSNRGKVEISAPGGDGSASGGCLPSANASYPTAIWSLTALHPACISPANPACSNANYMEAASGTSFAAPLVSAAAAMLFAQDPGLTPLQAQQRLLQTALPTSEGAGFHPGSGWGKLNFYGALTAAQGSGTGSALKIYNFPNPFAPERDNGTTFSFFLPAPAAVELRILDAGGDLVRHYSLGANETWPGMNLLRWDGLNGVGHSVANGGYLAVLESGGARKTCRVAVLR